MIHLERFSQPVKGVAPIINTRGQLRGRKFTVSVPDDWYHVTLEGSQVRVRKATLLERHHAVHKLPTLRVYPLGREGIVTQRTLALPFKMKESLPVHFLQGNPFSVVRIVQWEDGQWYMDRQDARFQRTLLREVRAAYEDHHTLPNLPGITPELRYYCILVGLEQRSREALLALQRLVLDPTELRRRLQSFQTDFKDRLSDAVIQAGGILKSFVKQGKGYLVTWELGGQTIKSTISEDLRVRSAGFCLSGDDTSHSLSSLAQLATTFQKENPLYITRE